VNKKGGGRLTAAFGFVWLFPFLREVAGKKLAEETKPTFGT
jgi:hypothetical protein